MSDYKVVNRRGKEIFTDVSLHPGEVLQMELAARDIKKSEFAEKLGMKPGHFSELLHGKRHVSAATAIKLEKLLDIPAEYWMRVQVYHDLFVERTKALKAA
jgi:HTH-type transcriptional regulator/antitoxin HigA